MQQTNEKTAEPSMEDILASIRKIISEEPASGKGAAKPGPMPLTPPIKPPAPAAAAVPPTPQVKATVEPPRPTAPAMPSVATAPAMAPPPATTSRLSDFMRELAPSAVPISAVPPAAFQDDLADLVEEPAPKPAPAVAKPAAVKPIEPLVAPAPVQTAAKPDPKPADLGAFIPSTAESLGLLTPHRPQPATVLAPRPAKTFDEAPALRLPDIAPAASERVSQSPEPAKPAASMPVPAPAAEAVSDPVAAAQSALGALAVGLATQPAASPGSGVAVVTAELDHPAARKSLDDTIVDMLRPMIGDWLDEHLPEMVEKALRQELADRAKQGR